MNILRINVSLKTLDSLLFMVVKYVTIMDEKLCNDLPMNIRRTSARRVGEEIANAGDTL